MAKIKNIAIYGKGGIGKSIKASNINAALSEKGFKNSEKFLKRAKEYHGHLGPFLVLGLNAGMLAIEYIGKNPFETRCIVKTALKPPRSCFIDGVQFVSGCTLGKGNIATENSNEISATFFRNDKKIRVRVRDDIIQKLSESLSEEKLEEIALEFSKKDYEDLFEVE